MSKALKKLLALTLAAVLLFGSAPILGVDFSTQASAASVTSSETGTWKALVPANTRVQGYQTATSTTNYRHYKPQDSQYYLYFNARYYLSDGTVRYRLIDADNNTIYFVLPSSVTILPNAPERIYTSGERCRDVPYVVSFTGASNADYYKIELDFGDGEYYSATVNNSPNATVSKSFYLKMTYDYVGHFGTVDITITPY